MHYCLNVVTDKNNFASGVLIRSVQIENEPDRIASGPGLLTKRFSIDSSLNGIKSYDNDNLKIHMRDINITGNDLIQTTRIGISQAKNLKWRWYMKNSNSISKRAIEDKNPKFNKNQKSN